jgi:hypothetical protein
LLEANNTHEEMVPHPTVVLVLALAFAATGGTKFGQKEGAMGSLADDVTDSDLKKLLAKYHIANLYQQMFDLGAELPTDLADFGQEEVASMKALPLEAIRLNRLLATVRSGGSASAGAATTAAATQAVSAPGIGVTNHKGKTERKSAEFVHQFTGLTIAEGSTFLSSSKYTSQRSLTDFLSYHVALVLGLGSHCPRTYLLSKDSDTPPPPFDRGDVNFFSSVLFPGDPNHHSKEKIGYGFKVVTEKVDTVTGIELVNISSCFSEGGADHTFSACGIPKNDAASANFVQHLYW